MKTFDLIIRVTANDNITKDEMFARFEKFEENMKDKERILFKGDCAITEIMVNEI